MAADAFSGVIVSSLSDSGQSKPKYEEPVILKSCYDPTGISITVQSGSVTIVNGDSSNPDDGHVFCCGTCQLADLKLPYILIHLL